jgi:hypothetical protein
MSLLQRLNTGKLDIIGDVHGEYEALCNLIVALGYDMDGNHPEGRKLVFVGDLCDRGPDSPNVIKLVKNLVEKGNAQCILGNHEINLLQLKAKDGAGWYFDEREKKDKNYEPFERVDESEKEMIYQFLVNLPLALENDELRIVHATWDNEKIEAIKKIAIGQVAKYYWQLENEIDESITSSGLLAAYNAEQEQWGEEQADPDGKLPFLYATAKYNIAHQMNNPLRVLTSGVEQQCEVPFYASGKWRFVERHTWWNDYQDDKAVIVGHFWRRFIQEENESSVETNVFEDIEPVSWHGVKNNVFCVDYSVGGRFKERNAGIDPGENTKLVAMRWPERELVLETGEVLKTENYLAQSLSQNKKIHP